MSTRQRDRLRLAMKAESVEMVENGDETEDEDEVESQRNIVHKGFNDLFLDDSDDDAENSIQNDDELHVLSDMNVIPIVATSTRGNKGGYSNKKKSNKKSKVSKIMSTPDELDEDVDLILHEVHIIPQRRRAYSWLEVNPSDLSIDLVMRRRFGAAVLEDPDKKNKSARRLLSRKFIFGQPKDDWVRPPPMLMRLTQVEPPTSRRTTTNSLNPQEIAGDNWLTFVWSNEYIQLNKKYIQIQATGDVNLLCNFLSNNPWHVEGFLQLAMVFARTGHMDKASDCVKLSLYVLEHAFSDLYKPHVGVCRFDAAILENQSYMSALFRHAQICSMFGCPTVSAAISLVLLSLDPTGDPFHTLLALDFYLLASGNHTVIDRMTSDDNTEGLIVGVSSLQTNIKASAASDTVALCDFPNWAFTRAISLHQQEFTEQADAALMSALRSFPFVLRPLLLKTDVSLDAYSPLDWRKVTSHEFFRGAQARLPTGSVLEHITEIYVNRHKSFWSRDVYVRWLYKCAMGVLDDFIEEVIAEQQKSFAMLSSNEALKQYRTANPEDYLDEFPRLPPEANPLDPRFLVPGAPIIQPMRGNDRQMLAAAGGDPEGNAIVQRIMELQEQGREAELNELLLGLQGFHGGQTPGAGALGPEMPLLQLFLQSLMPWNHFDPRARDDPDDEDF